MSTETDVVIESGDIRLEGMLGLPEGAPGVVVFAHGSGSGRFSPRNQFVARVLREKPVLSKVEGGVGTLLIDLLEEWESGDRGKVFDIDLLTERLLIAANWLRKCPDNGRLPLGYFGASTGAAAALQAAARNPEPVKAVVSRGGRPDLAEPYLPRVEAPTLLIVGGRDDLVIELNRRAFQLLTCEKELVIVPGATHLFEETGALEQVADLAADWFSKHFAAGIGAEWGRRSQEADK